MMVSPQDRQCHWLFDVAAILLHTLDPARSPVKQRHGLDVVQKPVGALGPTASE